MEIHARTGVTRSLNCPEPQPGSTPFCLFLLVVALHEGSQNIVASGDSVVYRVASVGQNNDSEFLLRNKCHVCREAIGRAGLIEPRIRLGRLRWAHKTGVRLHFSENRSRVALLKTTF